MGATIGRNILRVLVTVSLFVGLGGASDCAGDGCGAEAVKYLIRTWNCETDRTYWVYGVTDIIGDVFFPTAPEGFEGKCEVTKLINDVEVIVVEKIGGSRILLNISIEYENIYEDGLSACEILSAIFERPEMMTSEATKFKKKYLGWYEGGNYIRVNVDTTPEDFEKDVRLLFKFFDLRETDCETSTEDIVRKVMGGETLTPCEVERYIREAVLGSKVTVAVCSESLTGEQVELVVLEALGFRSGNKEREISDSEVKARKEGVLRKLRGKEQCPTSYWPVSVATVIPHENVLSLLHTLGYVYSILDNEVKKGGLKTSNVSRINFFIEAIMRDAILVTCDISLANDEPSVEECTKAVEDVFLRFRSLDIDEECMARASREVRGGIERAQSQTLTPEIMIYSMTSGSYFRLPIEEYLWYYRLHERPAPSEVKEVLRTLLDPRNWSISIFTSVKADLDEKDIGEMVGDVEEEHPDNQGNELLKD